MTGLRVLRIYHAGGDHSHRARERALLEAGVDVTIVVPSNWPDADDVDDVPVRRLGVRRPGDVNRHTYLDPGQLSGLVRELAPDVVDIHEEPVSLAARQWLRAAGDLPVVMYTAQNLDKRWPPPFAQYERAALRRTAAFYACSAQAASVLRGKGYGGSIRVLPLGIDPDVHHPGTQQLPASEVVLGLVGRLVPEKGVLDAVTVLAAVNQVMPARLLVIGDGPEVEPAKALSDALGVSQRCTWLPWCNAAELSKAYRRMHVVLVPSLATSRWVEQFGRVITEGQANGAVPVGYASGSIAEVIGAGGITVAEGDVTRLTSATASLVADPARWLALRRQGLQATAGRAWTSVSADQLDLYTEAATGTCPELSRASSGTRARAVEEFGPPARGPGGGRPFALPLLRNAGPISRGVAALIDRATRTRDVSVAAGTPRPPRPRRDQQRL